MGTSSTLSVLLSCGIFRFLFQVHGPPCSFKEKAESARLKGRNPSEAIFRTSLGRLSSAKVRI